MTPFGRHVHKTPPNGEAAFTSSLRFELVDEDERALLGSYAIASSLGVAFLLLIQFGPRMPLPIESARIGIIVGELNPFREPTPIRNSDNEKREGRPADGATRARATGKITNAFSGSAGSSTVGQPTNILGNVALTSSGGATSETGGKTVLGYGKGGDGSLAPLRGGISSGSGNDIGGVVRGGGVAHASQQVVVPPAIAVDPLPPLSDVGTVGTFVRGHEAQLRFCYEESGLAANPKLAGSVTVALTVAASGSVTTASVTKRSWGGAGAAEAEACILRAVRAWRLPASGRAASTYSFPFNFSR